jgi:hypothetical protein
MAPHPGWQTRCIDLGCTGTGLSSVELARKGFRMMGGAGGLLS